MEVPVKIELMGRPRVWNGACAVHFPFKPAEALFYYLLIEREATKDVLSEVIWESSEDPDKAQSSMRNAIYVLRKLFGREALTEPVKNTLQIAAELRARCDVELLYGPGELPTDFYRGEFLEGFALKKSLLYNEWAEMRRRELQAQYSKRRVLQIAACLEHGDLDLCERLCEELLRLDPYDDAVYLRLIDCHRQRGQFARAAAVYERLETLYREELFENPSPEMRAAARQLRREAQAARNQSPAAGHRPADQPALFGRAAELRAILQVAEDFFAGGRQAGVILTGEAGVGKTRLVEDLLESAGADVLVCTTTCFQVEEKYALRPWGPVLRRLQQAMRDAGLPPVQGEPETLQYAAAEAAATQLLGEVGRQRRLILFFDDLQWADEATITLIHRVASDRDMPVFFLLLLQQEAVGRKYLKDFLARMQYTGRMEMIVLRRLRAEDTVAMAHSLLPDYPFTKGVERQFYRETEGNPLFIVELANSIRCDGSLRDISPNIRELIRNRISNVPPACRSLLELLSLFYSGASFDLIKGLSQMDDNVLIEELEYLIEHKFIREKLVDGESVYKFTHQKIPEFIYSGMSQAKRRVFHRKAGAYYEAQLRLGPGSPGYYTYLIHHYERAGMRDKYLEYTIHYIHAYLGMAHEYFPVVNPSMVGADSASYQALTNVQGLGMHITMDEILELLAEFTTGLGEDPASWDPGSHALISRCYHLLSRYCIQSCRYEEGLKYIFKLKQLNRSARGAEQVRNLLCGCKQQLYIYINRYDTKGMHGALEEAFSLLPLLDDAMETAVWTRMRGMCGVMAGNMERGVADLEKAIHLFRSSGDPKLFLYNLAAAYAWLGEARRYLFDNGTAAAYYQQAISTCESYYRIGGVAVFYAYAGMNAFDSGEYDQAGIYLTQALESYGQASFLWGRGPALAYRALVHVQMGECAQAVEVLRQAERCVQMFGSRYEKGTLLRVKAMLRRRTDRDASCRKCLAPVLPDPPGEYIRRARELLRGVFSPVDSLYLSRMEQPGGEGAWPGLPSVSP